MRILMRSPSAPHWQPQPSRSRSRSRRPARRCHAHPDGHARRREAGRGLTLTNATGTEVRAITYGGIVTSWLVPDRRGQLADIVLGYDDPAAYVKNDSPHFGAIVGRYGDRIAKARFALDGRTYPLAANDGVNHLHGGTQGSTKCSGRVKRCGAAQESCSRARARTARRGIQGT